MDISSQIASEITIFSKYAKYLPKQKRRENWDEIVNRVRDMHIRKYPKLHKEITEVFEFVRLKKVLPSMRSLQFGGKAIEVNNARLFNCCAANVEEPKFFAELMFTLLGGSGFGYSVQSRHISKLPAIQQVKKARKFLIQDSIIGWADSVKALFGAYLEGKYLPLFDFTEIRHKGEPLKTAGGKAPGPAPLRTALAKLQGLLEAKAVGSRLSSVEVSDCACIIADAVRSGGIRRSAMICLFDIDDEAMLSYKSGEWYNTNPERARANVSACALRKDYDSQPQEYCPDIVAATTKEQFDNLWHFVEASRSGEPGIYWSSDLDHPTNPCCEIALRSKEMCNLTTVNYTTIETEEDLMKAVWAATAIGTLQASYTDFHYLSEEWKVNCEEEALLGVSITGIADGGHYKKFDWYKASKHAEAVNLGWAALLGIRPAARICCIKPEGTASLVLGSSSGIHARHSHYYIRRQRLDKSEALAIYLMKNHPELIVQDETNPSGVIVELPQKAPDRSIYRTESPINLLERVKYFHENWIKPSHTSGPNTHNVSCTVSIKEDEWAEVGEWLWQNKDSYNGLSVLPFDEHIYLQPPFEPCDKEEYEKRMEHLKLVDLSKISEEDDATDLSGEMACAGGSCDLV